MAAVTYGRKCPHPAKCSSDGGCYGCDEPITSRMHSNAREPLAARKPDLAEQLMGGTVDEIAAAQNAAHDAATVCEACGYPGGECRAPYDREPNALCRLVKEGSMVTTIRDALRDALEPAGFWVGGTGNVLHVVEVTNPDRFGDVEVTIRLRPKLASYDGRRFEVDERGGMTEVRSG